MTISCLPNYKIHRLVSCPWLLPFYRLLSLSITKLGYVYLLSILSTHFILSNSSLLPESISLSFPVSDPKFLKSGVIFLKSKSNYATPLPKISELFATNSYSRTEYKRPFMISPLISSLRSPHDSFPVTNRHSSFHFSLCSCSLWQACTSTSLFTWKNSTWTVRFSLGSFYLRL